MDFDPIPETVDDALAMWDSDQTLFVVEMGGLGPGYEMAIQALAFELMREWRKVSDLEDAKALEKISEPIVNRCDAKPWGGFSGAQVGAAKNLAYNVCKKGYRTALRQKNVEDRLIQVCRLDLRTKRRTAPCPKSS